MNNLTSTKSNYTPLDITVPKPVINLLIIMITCTLLIFLGIGYLLSKKILNPNLSQKAKSMQAAFVPTLTQPVPTSTPLPTNTILTLTEEPMPIAAKINKSNIIDHNSISSFDKIPDDIITNVAKLRLMLRHASVGGNINNGLDNIYKQNAKYVHDNWKFQSRGNPGWQPKIDDLVSQTAAQINNFDIFSMKFCYIDNNADPTTVWNYYRDRMKELQTNYPNKKFIWWTMPIMTTGDKNRDTFNNLVRVYAQTHNVILFDVAAIESHDESGNAAINNGYEAMYKPYSSDGGHLNSQGSERVARAFWVMTSTLAGL